MLTLRRILKYTPAVVLGLLILAWVASLFCYVDLNLERRAGDTRSRTLSYAFASLGYWSNESPSRPRPAAFEFGWLKTRESLQNPAGFLRRTPRVIYVPFLLLITAIFPLAIGPFLSFRFRLWHYLAYTTVVAVELAYYLRWQV